MKKAGHIRAEILRTAALLASQEGLEGISLARLAAERGMSKSGLFAHFASKEDLQLGAIETARQIFIEEVVEPTRQAPGGLARLRTLIDKWLNYAEREVFPGGCFFAAVSAEFDGRPGIIRNRIADSMRRWLQLIAAEVRHACKNREIHPRSGANQLAFEINALMMGANWAYQLLGEKQAFRWARDAMIRLLERDRAFSRARRSKRLSRRFKRTA